MIDFNELINNFLKKEARPRTPGRYYPSEASNCLRKAFYSYKFPREADVEVLKLFEAGNMVHDLVSSVIKSEKNPHVELLASESPIFISHEDFLISGRMDDVLLIRLDGKVYILEVKSVSSLIYTNSAKSGHVAQLQLYMHSTGIHQGLILYIERNSLKTKTYDVAYSQDLVKRILSRFANLHNSIKTDVLPAPEARIQKQEMGWQCDKCQYRKECFEATHIL